MAELGALSLRIETIGDKQALRALDAIDTKAAKAGISVTSTVAALNKLGISARQVGGQIQVADSQLEQATQIVRRLGSQAQVTAGDLQRLGSATAQAAAAPAQPLQVLGRDVVQASGKLTAFGKSGLNAFNALSFGLSQMAATGQTSFRSLATASASVLSFFGPQGAIAAAVIATGLVLVDFWRRQKKEVAEFQQLVTALIEESDRVSREKNPFRFAQQDLQEVEKELAAFEARRDRRLKQIAEVGERRGSALNPSEKRELEEMNAERARLLQAQFQAQRRLQDAIQAMTKGLPEVKVGGKTNEQLAKERQQAIEAEIAALSSLQKARGLTSVELLRLIDLEATLTKELASGNLTKVREAEVWEQIAKARTAAGVALPAAVVRPITPGRAQPKGTLEKPTGALAQFLSPEQIAADIQAADAAMAARVAAFNFQQTQESLSQSLGNAIAFGIANGFAMGLGEGGIGEGFKQMAAQMAQGLGSVAIDYGLKAKAIATLMSKVSAWMIANPALAILGGIALVAAGRALGGRGGVGSGGGAFAGGGPVGTSPTPISLSRLIVDPNADLRQRAAAGLGRMTAATPLPNPLAGVEFLVATSPAGQEFIVTKVVRPYEERGG